MIFNPYILLSSHWLRYQNLFSCGDNAIPGNIEGQVALGSEQSDPVEGVPAHCKGIGADEF